MRGMKGGGVIRGKNKGCKGASLVDSRLSN